MIAEFLKTTDDERLKQVINLFKEISDSGLPTGKEKFRHLKGVVYELKTNKGVRILCFQGGIKLPRSLILTQGFIKPHRKVLQREIEKATGWHEEFLKIRDVQKIIVEMEIKP